MIPLLLTFGCAEPLDPVDPVVPAEPFEDQCPADGSQIGEPDCVGNYLQISLRSDGAPIDGVVRWTRLGCATVDLDCPDGECLVLDAVPGDYEVTATAGDLSETVDLTLDDEDRVVCSDCCYGEALVEQLTFEL